MSPLFSSTHRAPGQCSARYAAVTAGAVRMSSADTGNPASASVRAIDARVREVVFVTSATPSPASRISRSASTAPGSGCHETVRTPSMSIRTARRDSTPRTDSMPGP